MLVVLVSARLEICRDFKEDSRLRGKVAFVFLTSLAWLWRAPLGRAGCCLVIVPDSDSESGFWVKFYKMIGLVLVDCYTYIYI